MNNYSFGLVPLRRVGRAAFPAVFALAAVSCSQSRDAKAVAPWGDDADSIASLASDFDLDRILGNGEMIMLTLTGPETYYDYHGKPMGAQYMLCQMFADSIGVSLRVEVCRDTVEMLAKLEAGDADVIAFPLPKRKDGDYKDLLYCGAGVDSLGVQWAVSGAKPRLAEALDDWYRPSLLAEVRREESRRFGAGSVRRRVYAPMLDSKAGVISRYDAMFRTYCMPIRWDWRLMAAQCYQESTFDPQARSWAGACGLMQIMPATASALGLPMDKIFDPESNISAAARFLGQLESKFKDVADRDERMNFVLASYNGGYHHIRDAMALAARDGHDSHRWADVSRYVLLLATPRYYNDPLVKYGYMRGSETVGYVSKIRQRWQSYSGVRGGGFGGSVLTPRKAKQRKKKFEI